MTRHSFHFSTASVSLFIEGRPVEVLLVGSHAAKTHKSADSWRLLLESAIFCGTAASVHTGRKDLIQYGRPNVLTTAVL